ncbi:MAG: twin-arginine translocase subunit TatB [Syntrophomonadaceae bacterium]|nr:twin-arginine translocase subunit TatB [Syntrophomonadaceae bacterium]
MYFAFIGNIGTWEILLILFVALIVFGPGKLPEVAKTIGKTLGEIKRVTSGVQKEFQDAINLEADTSDKKSTTVKNENPIKSDADTQADQNKAKDEATEEQDHKGTGLSEDASKEITTDGS